MATLLCEKETYAILGACFEVYRTMGCGFLEAVFHGSLAIEFQLRGIPAQAQVPIHVSYKGHPLRQGYIADYICFDQVLLELKSTSALADEHRAQLQNYLHAAKLRVGLLVNFGHYPQLEYERFVL